VGRPLGSSPHPRQKCADPAGSNESIEVVVNEKVITDYLSNTRRRQRRRKGRRIEDGTTLGVGMTTQLPVRAGTASEVITTEEVPSELDDNGTIETDVHESEYDMIEEDDVPEEDSEYEQYTEENRNIAIAEVTQGITTVITEMFGDEHGIEIDDIARIVKEAVASTSDIYGISDAVKAYGDHRFREDVAKRDTERYQEAGFDLATMTAVLQNAKRSERLNMDRIERVITDATIHDPADIERLKELATVGMIVMVNDDPGEATEAEPTFIQGQRPPLRNLYQQVKGAVNQNFENLHALELAFLLPADLVFDHERVHGSPAHWGKKKGKREGRPLYDASDNKHGTPLNTKAAKERLKAHYGEIRHPTIVNLIVMVLDYAAEQKAILGADFRWEDLRIFQKDLKRAFTLLSYRSTDVPKIASELTDGLIAVFHAGVFGWVGTPYCFAVVTRILEAEINRRILAKGRIRMYVDDLNGVTMTSHLPTCHREAVSTMEELLGNEAHEPRKDKDGLVLDWIGYEVNLIEATVSISLANFHKVLFGFCSVEVTKPVTVRLLEKLCSWSARYTIILRVLRPFTNILYGEKKGLGRNKNVTVLLSPLGRVAVYVWRAVLVLLRLKHTNFARPFRSFRDEAPAYQVEYDASLSGIGVILRDLREYDAGNPTSGIIGVTGVRFPFDLGQDSKYQNTCEYIGATIGMAMLARLGIRRQTLKLKGDSRASLKWGCKGLFKGTLSRRATFVHILAAVQFELYIGEAEHIEGIRHVWCDGLSRGKTPEELGIPVDRWFNMASDLTLMEILTECDPRPEHEIVDESTFFEFWRSVRRLLSNLN